MGRQADWSELSALALEAERGGGVVGISVLGPAGETFAHRGARRFRAASTVKVPLLIEFLRQVDRGECALDAPYTLRAADKAIGSGVLSDLHDGLVLTYHDLIYLMISISDNTATNILIDRADMARVDATMRDLGMTHSTLRRKMQGRPAEGDEEENWATPEDYTAVIKAILDNRAASAAACECMLAMLEKQQNPRRIARYLPAGDGIRWGSKTGTIKGVTNDVGFITTVRGTLIISVFCENLPDPHVAERVIGTLSRAAMLATGIVKPLPVA